MLMSKMAKTVSITLEIDYYNVRNSFALSLISLTLE